MQVRTLPSLVLPRLPSNAAPRTVAPVIGTDERSQPPVIIPATRNRRPESSDVELLATQNQRYSYVKIDTDGSKTTRALQTYINIETQQEQERSQTLFGIDVLA